MSGLVAFALTVVLTPVVLGVLHRSGVLDHPNARSSHDEPVVRGGGIAISIASLLSLLTVRNDISRMAAGVIVAAVISGLVGVVEDVRGVSTLPRFALQLMASAAACMWLLDGLDGPVMWRVVFATGALLWIPAYVNGFNFMDGINGISSVQSAVCGLAWVWLGATQDVPPLVWGGAILAGAALGFLPFNFPSARLFLGDVGSYFIGGWQAGLLVVGFRAGLPPEAVIAPLLIYLADTATTILRRVRAGEILHQPHREHAYQRLIRQGWSHASTTALVGAFVAATSAIGLLALRTTAIRITADVVLVVLLAAYVALPSWTHRRVGETQQT